MPLLELDSESCILELFGAASLLRGALGAGCAGVDDILLEDGEDGEDDEEPPAVELEEDDPLTIAIGLIFSIFFADNPAFDKSFTDE